MLKSPINYSMPANCPQNPLPHETSSTSSSSSSPNLWEAGLGHFSKTLASVAHCTPFSSPSSAGDRIRLWHLFCIAGPKDWLKEQKKKSIKYILAPIDASVDLLQSAHQLLLAKDSDDKRNVWEQIQGLLRSASRDCVPEERNSFVAFQAKTGVEVCTFKLVVKNASSLLDDNDPTKVKAEGMLGDLIRSFTVLNGVAKEANYQLVSDRKKIADALMDTIASLHKFEEGVKGCIQV